MSDQPSTPAQNAYGHQGAESAYSATAQAVTTGQAATPAATSDGQPPSFAQPAPQQSPYPGYPPAGYAAAPQPGAHGAYYDYSQPSPYGSLPGTHPAYAAAPPHASHYPPNQHYGVLPPPFYGYSNPYAAHHPLQPPGHQVPYHPDPSGQLGPPGAKPRVTTTLWEDEGTLCFQVEAKGICVARREDNDMINGTKLLNVAGMSRGKRDGILKSEKTRHVVKIGAMHLKGVWIPFERALEFANKEHITDLLYPLFVNDIKTFLYHPTNYARTAAVMAAAQQRQQLHQRRDSEAGAASPSGATGTAVATPTAQPANAAILGANDAAAYWQGNGHAATPVAPAAAPLAATPATPAADTAAAVAAATAGTSPAAQAGALNPLQYGQAQQAQQYSASLRHADSLEEVKTEMAPPAPGVRIRTTTNDGEDLVAKEEPVAPGTPGSASAADKGLTATPSAVAMARRIETPVKTPTGGDVKKHRRGLSLLGETPPCRNPYQLVAGDRTRTTTEGSTDGGEELVLKADEAEEDVEGKDLIAAADEAAHENPKDEGSTPPDAPIAQKREADEMEGALEDGRVQQDDVFVNEDGEVEGGDERALKRRKTVKE
ncbi:hypothetical protein G7K_0619-t1 [Saitoella complicata NRRL Y-17804]|uniref:HTH APSES-type domain-containing protein n=2 Tax=Saitoella complicata (strain BCRC 22490 / CBS 7301 / JCM 7358 / NBRC 10748 / NRRL Y-17804) TaxID=698492 RepID=A0A0E9N9C8_SAICN|nr:hypothetical protein G7K_0619-t1 [Saitoella complicata NRRL Y-17804]